MQACIALLVILATLQVFAGCSGKKDEPESSDAAEDQPSLAASSQKVSSEDVNNLDSLVDRIVDEAGKLPRAGFDPAALARQLGDDPEMQLAWVRDHTWWAPYRGLLRGAQGVLLDRVGSNLDRAVLLGDLLRRSGHEVRLAHAELPQGLARELLDKIRPTPLPRTIHTTQTGVVNEARRTSDKAGLVANAQASELYAMVKGTTGKSAARDEQAAISAMRDYWWIERRQNGRWIAMDIVPADARAGDAATTATSTHVWDPRQAMPDIPDADWHTVQVRVVIERYADDALSESTVLESTLRPAELLERPVMLMHMPQPWPATLPDPSSDPNAVGNAAVSVEEWVPYLQVGDQLVAQSGFTDSGDLIAAPFDAKRDIADTGGAGFMSGFGEALGGDAAASSSLTAEWLDFEIRVPGAAAERVRRPVFDLLGPVGRSGRTADFDANSNERLIERYEALLSSTQIFLQVADLTAAFYTHLETRSIVANQADIRKLSKERDAATAGKLAATILDRLDVWGPLPALALWRSELGEQQRALFIDRPNVLSYRIGPPAVNADRVVFQEQIDIASNSMSVVWGAGRNPFEGRLRQGVADTVAEVLVLGGDFGSTENTAAFFEMARADPNRGQFVGASDAETVRGLDWPADAVARLEEDVNAGFIAVALRQPLAIDDIRRVGWWRIDPDSGGTIGVMDTGFHGAMDERVEMELEIVQLRNSLRNWLSNNASRIRAARERANVPWDAAAPGDEGLLYTTNRVMDVLRQVALAGF